MYRIAWYNNTTGQNGFERERLEYYLAQEILEDLMFFGDGSIYYWLEVA